MNTADFIASRPCLVRADQHGTARWLHRPLRIAHLGDAFRLRVDVHGNTHDARHLCTAIPTTTLYESLVTPHPVVRKTDTDEGGVVTSTRGPKTALLPRPEYLSRSTATCAGQVPVNEQTAKPQFGPTIHRNTK